MTLSWDARRDHSSRVGLGAVEHRLPNELLPLCGRGGDAAQVAALGERALARLGMPLALDARRGPEQLNQAIYLAEVQASLGALGGRFAGDGSGLGRSSSSPEATRPVLLGALAPALAAIGAVVALLQTSARNRRTYVLAQRGQLTERFTKAIDQLGQTAEDKLDIRLVVSMP